MTERLNNAFAQTELQPKHAHKPALSFGSARKAVTLRVDRVDHLGLASGEALCGRQRPTTGTHVHSPKRKRCSALLNKSGSFPLAPAVLPYDSCEQALSAREVSAP
ncbi:hypothetical protein WJX73_003734 [Symbiochloris irregularis]|uniref:Uncharacterized protein n=1 Tax=Symbiochloris irregularis TaxID=706552 RepID=A0AAW1PBU9_9CHLO